PLELIELAAAAGLAATGLRTRAASPGAIEYPLRTAFEQAEMRRRIAATGVAIDYIELVSLSEATDIAGCRPMLEVGAAVGATRTSSIGRQPAMSVASD